MRELTFFTTNQTKLAHARYVAEGRQVRIKGFRQRTYHADYIEPRLANREEVMKASYESALAQLAKAGFSEATHPFVLEDTSVRINALSTPTNEVPGVDIKYWMEDQSFSDLDRLLREKGNDRSATVRSDVLLHVPSEYKSAWGIEDDYVIFTGEQVGAIIDAEVDFEANLLYPWLDNRSFNKWFVPDGADQPLGALPISTADSVDFRRRSFGSLFDFLESRRYFVTASPPLQLRLQLDYRPNFILCGYTCSGKTTASQRLARIFGYLHIEASDFMHLAYYYRHGYRGPVAIGDFAEQALAQKPTIAAEKVAEYLLDHAGEPVVISGFRAPDEIRLLEDVMKRQGKLCARLFVSASESTRFARLQARGRPGDDLDLTEFRARDLQQTRMGLGAIQKSLQTSCLENEGDLAAYLELVDGLAGQIDGEAVGIEEGLSLISQIKEVVLQDAILIALLWGWKDDETRYFYSTTEIARLIAGAFPYIRPKHKDNVSRYFNQDYYAFYEIAHRPDNSTRIYRLSNTGYGAAIKTLRALLARMRA